MKHIGFLAPTVYNYFIGKGFGGAELQVVQLSKMFIRAGYKVTVLTNDFGQADKEIYDDIHVVKAPLRFLGGSNLYFLPDTLRFISKVRKLKLDWCFFLTPNTALFQLGLAKLFSKNMKICKYIASDLDCQNNNDLAYRLYKLGLKMTDTFLFQTKTQQQMAEKNLHISGELLPNIFNPPAETCCPTRRKSCKVSTVCSCSPSRRSSVPPRAKQKRSHARRGGAVPSSCEKNEVGGKFLLNSKTPAHRTFSTAREAPRRMFFLARTYSSKSVCQSR